MTNVRIAIPAQARPGEAVEIKTLITHPMESGFRRDGLGRAIPRNILTDFECRLDGVTVFKMELETGIAANPYVTFFARVAGSGTFEFLWRGENGFSHREERRVNLVGG